MRLKIFIWTNESFLECVSGKWQGSRTSYLSWEDRCSDVSHKILSTLESKGLIAFSVSETIIKNIIFKAINDYSRIYDKAEDAVFEKLKKYKRKLTYGTERI